MGSFGVIWAEEEVSMMEDKEMEWSAHVLIVVEVLMKRKIKGEGF